MANIFILILASMTLVTGIIWCFDKLKLIMSYRKKNSKLDTKNDKILCNKKNINIVKSKFNWLETSSSIFPVLLFVFIVRSFIYEPFQIPSSSMMPTLLIGDFILVEKYTYGIKNPLTQTTLINTGHPNHGDIAVFKYPLNPELNYIKRIIGLPGDHIIYNFVNKQVIVKPICKNNSLCNKKSIIIYDKIHPSNFVQAFVHNNVDEISNYFYKIPLNNHIPKNSIRLYESKEKNENIKYSTLIIPGTQDQILAYYKQTGKSLAEWVVPEGYYFMMGDNRDNSSDSRYWGFVPEKNLVGKAIAIWMSFEKQENKWPTGLRLNRIGFIY
ncbi:Signal peptidase I [Serratia symbiotica]|nr:Signal peptidase I [Serratia symbiotica]